MKFDIRVGICLAALTISTACSKSPEAPTAPSATRGAPSAAAADGSTLKFNAPALVTPVEGARAEDRRPTLVWANAQSKYAGVGVAYDLQVETATAMVYEQTVGESENFGQHLIPFDLEFDTKYFWRVRARVGNEFGPWSNHAEFVSPARPAPTVPTFTPGSPTACAAPMSAMGPGEVRKPRPNHSAVVRGIANAFPALLSRSCQEHGGTWEFMDRSVDALRAIDGRYGYNAKRGNMNDPSVDVASYFWGNHDGFQGSSQVYIFDIIGGHCGSNPFIVWNDVTDITYASGTVGRTMYPRPGRNVTPTTCGAAGQ
jgi:hypothetical protein